MSLTDRVVDLRRQFGTLLIIIATPQKTRKRERENLRSKIKRKKNSGLSLSLSLSLSLFLARARASVRFSLAHIAYRGFSFTFTLRHVDTSFFSQSSPAFRMQKRTRAAPRNETKREREREREKRDTKKKYEREREHRAHTDCFIISAIGSARATSRALVQQPHLIFVIIGYLSNHKDLFLRIITSARFVSYTIWFRATVKVMFEIIEYTSTRFS